MLGVLQALDSWLAEDHSRVEVRLTQRDAVAHMVQLYARSCAAQVRWQMRQGLWGVIFCEEIKQD